MTLESADQAPTRPTRRCDNRERTGILYRVDTAPAQHSADGSWWWTGTEWMPAKTPDGRWWFDGHAWRRLGLWKRIGPLERRLGLVWLVGAAIACLWAGLSAPHVTPDDGLTGGWLVSFAVIFFSWPVGMVLTGYVLTKRGRSSDLRAFVAGVWLLMGCWTAFVAFEPTPASQPGDDIGPGLGLVVLGIPALVVLWLLAFLGSAVARAVGRRAHDPSSAIA